MLGAVQGWNRMFSWGLMVLKVLCYATFDFTNVYCQHTVSLKIHCVLRLAAPLLRRISHTVLKIKSTPGLPRLQ